MAQKIETAKKVEHYAPKKRILKSNFGSRCCALSRLLLFVRRLIDLAKIHARGNRFHDFDRFAKIFVGRRRFTRRTGHLTDRIAHRVADDAVHMIASSSACQMRVISRRRNTDRSIATEVQMTHIVRDGLQFFLREFVFRPSKRDNAPDDSCPEYRNGCTKRNRIDSDA